MPRKFLNIMSRNKQIHIKPKPFSSLSPLVLLGFSGGASGKEPTCQCKRHKRHGFDPWVGKIPWRWAWQPTPVFLPGESPWTEEPARLQPIELQRVGHNCSDLTQHSIRFIAKLRLQRKLRYRELSLNHLPLHVHSVPFINIAHQSSTLQFLKL